MKTREAYRYEKGKIVGIYDRHNKLIYITSTIMDIVRFCKKIVYVRIFAIPPKLTTPIASYAYQNDMGKGWSVKLLEEYPCDAKWKMNARVQQLVRRHKPIVNMHLYALYNFRRIEKRGKKIVVQCPCCKSSSESSSGDDIDYAPVCVM